MEAIVDVKNLGISTKKSIEIANFIRHKNLENAKKMLKSVIEMKQAVPYKRHNKDIPHRPGMMAGRYPIKTCEVILKLLDSVKANAQNKGLSSNLVISEIVANQGNKQMHSTMKGRMKMKRTHLRIVVKEIEKKETKK
ncbi:MAG: 50S ribosomal protein L22 [Nanoarchaeota archaeon]